MGRKVSCLESVFEGFPAEGLKFFKDLKLNNEREWFQENKKVYEKQVKEPAVRFVVALSAKFEAAGLELCGDSRSIFRINRDIRFSQDKSPYKTHLGVVLSRDGDKRSPGLFYLHVDPAGPFLGSGFYHPEPAQLDAIRGGIVDRSAQFKRVIKKLAESGLCLDQEDSLKRLPRGFESASDDIHGFLKMKNLIICRDIKPADLKDGTALLDICLDFARTTYPLLKFGWAAIDDKAQ